MNFKKEASKYEYRMGVAGKLFYLKETGKRVPKKYILKEVLPFILPAEGCEPQPEEISNNPDDYFYYFTSTGAKRFFLRINRKAVPAKKIPFEIRDRIRPIEFDLPEIPRAIVQTSILVEMNITTKKEWKLWLCRNHPDKGGDTELCAKVISAGKDIGY